MKKEIYNRAKELECKIDYIKGEIKAVDKAISFKKHLPIRIETKQGDVAILHNSYNFLKTYLKKYKEELNEKLISFQKEFNNL